MSAAASMSFITLHSTSAKGKSQQHDNMAILEG
jgi:hypothetical protein